MGGRWAKRGLVVGVVLGFVARAWRGLPEALPPPTHAGEPLELIADRGWFQLRWRVGGSHRPIPAVLARQQRRLDLAAVVVERSLVSLGPLPPAPPASSEGLLLPPLPPRWTLPLPVEGGPPLTLEVIVPPSAAAQLAAHPALEQRLIWSLTEARIFTE